MRDKLILLGGILSIFAIGGSLMVSIEWLRPDGHNAQLDTEITGLATLIVGQLFAQWRNASKLDTQTAELKDKAEEVKKTVAVPVHEAATQLSQKADELVKTATATAMPREVKAEVVLHTDKP